MFAAPRRFLRQKPIHSYIRPSGAGGVRAAMLRSLVKVGVDDLAAIVEAVKASLRVISQANDPDIKRCGDLFKTLTEISETAGWRSRLPNRFRRRHG